MLAHTRLPPPASDSHPNPFRPPRRQRRRRRRRRGVPPQALLHLSRAPPLLPLLAAHPALRSAPPPLLHASLRLLLSNGRSSRDAYSVFSAFPSLITSPPDEHLRFLSAATPLLPPLLLAASVPDTLSPAAALHFLRRRVSLRRRPLPLAAVLLLAFSVDRTILPRLLFLHDATGLPDPAVCAVLCRSPAILSYGIETNLMPKLQFLTDRMGRDPAAELAEFPHYFAFSLEGRIRPMHEALRERGVEMSLKDMLTSSDDEFRLRLLDAALSATKERMRACAQKQGL